MEFYHESSIYIVWKNRGANQYWNFKSHWQILKPGCKKMTKSGTNWMIKSNSKWIILILVDSSLFFNQLNKTIYMIEFSWINLTRNSLKVLKCKESIETLMLIGAPREKILRMKIDAHLFFSKWLFFGWKATFRITKTKDPQCGFF